MAKRDRLRQRAKNSRHNFGFDDLCQLAKCYGFQLDRISGSHHIYIHEELQIMQDFQPKNGKAKPFQIDQLLEAIEFIEAQEDD